MATIVTDGVRERYVLGEALENLMFALTGETPSRAFTLAGAPFEGLPRVADDQLTRLTAQEFEVLFPAEAEMDGGGYPGQAEAIQEAALLTARMFLALAGASEFCAREAERYFIRAGVVPERLDDDA